MDNLNTRWTGIKVTTEKQKENLRNAGKQFAEVDGGIKELLKYFKELEVLIREEKFNAMDRPTLRSKITDYQVS